MITMPTIQEQRSKAESPADWMITDCSCSRCGCLMVSDQHVDLSAMRCVQCGEVIDPIILQNRRRHLPAGIVRHAIPGLAVRSLMLVLSLTLVGMSVPAIAADHDRQINQKADYAAELNAPAGAAGQDWKSITVELQPGAADSWQSRPDGELLYVLEGAGRFEMNGMPPMALNPGTVARLSGTPHHVLKNTSRTRTLKVLIVFLRDAGQEQHPLHTDHRPGSGRDQHESVGTGLIF